jgi:kumamolisin
MKPIKGSERTPMPGATDAGDADPRERLEVTVLLRQRDPDAWARQTAALQSKTPPAPISREQYAASLGADPGDIAAVKTFAEGHGLAVVASDAARRTVILSGTVAQFNDAFGVRLRRFEHPGGAYRGRTGAIQLPEALAPAVEAVLGLDNRPQAKPHFRTRLHRGNVQWLAPGALPQSSASFTPIQLAALYDFPAGDGAGECVGIVELGGGYRPADLKTYFAGLGVSPAPQVISVSVDHGKNSPTGSADGPDGEVMLDVEVVGSVAPGAKLAVYFAPNTDAGFVDAVSTAAHDAVNKPSIVSISWGGPESSWTGQAMQAFDQALQAAALMGVTVCIASGDDGSSDGVATGDHVNFPASSPHALACGGTTLQASGGTITREAVWNDGASGGASGGGVSTVFALPAWQEGLEATTTGGQGSALAMRGVPDVSGDADPETGYVIRVDGADMVIGGTSAVAPLWAGLFARLNAIAGKPAGYVNASLYAEPAAFRDITSGDNGDFAATVGWDACTGLGSPNGAKLTLT